MESSRYTHQIHLLGSDSGLIKQLSGFRKKLHFVPEAHTPAADEFVRKIADDELQQEANALFDAIKQNFGYKRREISLELNTGKADISTAAFDLSLSYSQDAGQADCYTLEYQISNVQNPNALLDDGLQNILCQHFDRLRFNLTVRMDIEALIDKLEAAPPPSSHSNTRLTAATLSCILKVKTGTST